MITWLRTNSISVLPPAPGATSSAKSQSDKLATCYGDVGVGRGNGIWPLGIDRRWTHADHVLNASY